LVYNKENIEDLSMSGSVNKVTLVGNLGRDPEVRHTNDGNRIVHLSIATSDVWKDKTTGERKDRTEWHRVVIFNEKLGEIAEKYLQKGAKVYLEGQLQTRKWTDQSGVEKYTTEVILPRFRGEMTLLDSRSSGGASGFSEPAPMGSTSSGAATALAESPELDDEIPF
jgi:single-strand DNA-binding protein